jgi:hypothetical protein
MERLADIDMGQITANDTELAGVYCYKVLSRIRANGMEWVIPLHY